MWLIVLMIVAASVSAILLTMTLINLWVLGRPGVAVTGDPRLVSICIPARNEAPNIEACVKGLLASNHPNVEVLVYDDQSTDATSTILRSLCDIDPRVRTTPTLPLPEGWNGKQHACWRLAAAAKGDWLLFTDADVRFEPDAVGTALSEADRLQADLISGFPRQITRTFAESLIVPMIFFVLFSYLPFPRMRLSNDPAASAGCGQFLFVSRRGYDACGGHAGFKDSMHDGIRMPRAVRRAGLQSDLADITGVTSCRMYSGSASTWRGFAKNAYEGLGSPFLLLFLSITHLSAQVLPWMVLAWSGFAAFNPVPAGVNTVAVGWAAIAVALMIVQRLILAGWSRTPLWTAVLHPLALLAVTALQWHSFGIHLSGQRAWKGRIQRSTPSVAA